jgi:F-type H+-transporting ATPase subunit delta
MNDSKISVRYSRALFQSALEKKILDEVNQDMIFISEICAIPETKEFLHSPIIIPSKKEAIFHKILGDNVQKITLSLIDLIVTKESRKWFLQQQLRLIQKLKSK